MAKIVPFRALRYNLSKISDAAAIAAPPYDAISPALQDALYHRSPFNIVRLTLGKTYPADNASVNRYSRAAADFKAWQKEGVLVRDPEPSFYLYDQTYPSEDGSSVTRKGLVALARLEDFSAGGVQTHEKTFSGQKADRLLLTRACRANFSPIFSLYSDPCCAIEALGKQFKQTPPAMTVVDDDGACHFLWPVNDPSFIDRVRDLLEKKPYVIADGHRRYEAALNYRDEMRAAHPDFTGKEAFNYVLMYFANMGPSEVRDVANANEKMPEESTSFYPRLLSGLVIHSHD